MTSNALDHTSPEGGALLADVDQLAERWPLAGDASSSLAISTRKGGRECCHLVEILFFMGSVVRQSSRIESEAATGRTGANENCRRKGACHARVQPAQAESWTDSAGSRGNAESKCQWLASSSCMHQAACFVRNPAGIATHAPGATRREHQRPRKALAWCRCECAESAISGLGSIKRADSEQARGRQFLGGLKERV
jgi:hypothetical protein